MNTKIVTIWKDKKYRSNEFKLLLQYITNYKAFPACHSSSHISDELICNTDWIFSNDNLCHFCDSYNSKNHSIVYYYIGTKQTLAFVENRERFFKHNIILCVNHNCVPICLAIHKLHNIFDIYCVFNRNNYLLPEIINYIIQFLIDDYLIDVGN